MTNLNIKIETLKSFGARATKAMKEAQAGRLREAPHSVSFPTYAAMHATLSPARLNIVGALAGQGALSMRQIAARVERDVKAVHSDVTRLINAGIVERDEEGVRFDYDGLQFDFKVRVAA